MGDLLSKKCVLREIGTKPMSPQEVSEMIKQIPDWFIVGNKITKDFKFPDFKTALEFVNKIGQLAENEGHHPDILLSWGKVNITLTTHDTNGLTEKDFLLATKIDQL